MPKQPPIDISIDRFADSLEQAARNDIPDILGQAAVDAFKQNFQDEGFFGSGWKEVKRHQGHARGAAASRPILTGSTSYLAYTDSESLALWLFFYASELQLMALVVNILEEM